MDIQKMTVEHVVIGSGAAGFQAALRLKQNGEEDVVLLTEKISSGTSRNTGSDKQTYYKLSLASQDMDSVRAMAEDLFAGQCVDGDQALCEAALSTRCFFRLVELGVAFPCTEYGEFMGYKTDHDRGRRATSAGPYTSRQMTECLEREVRRQEIQLLYRVQAIRLLVKDQQIYGVLCLDMRNQGSYSYLLIWCSDVILATGGPAGIYHDSVYPASQLGSTGMAFEAGAEGKNLTEWQFGLASLNPRWNVSGTYMQVLPRFIPTDAKGGDEREFLLDFYQDMGQMLSMVFLKGYQWPFDVSKIFGGSSVIDLLVYQETVLKGRKVYLDFTQNPGGGDIPFEKLSSEAYDYLKQAGALFGTPIERLKQMNEPAIAFYQDHQVNLYQEPLEIAVCAQHNNGGIGADKYWETRIKGLFAAGEVCASHGVTRPGGTALNAGQVGALRAAERIHLRKIHGENREENLQEIQEELLKEAEEFTALASQAHGKEDAGAMWVNAAKRMSAMGGMIRDQKRMKEALEKTNQELEHYLERVKHPKESQLPLFYRLRDMLITQKVYLSAMLDYAQSGAGSRGSALYTDASGEKPDPGLPDLYRCRLDQGAHGGVVQEICLNKDQCSVHWRDVRPIPEVDYFFENQWKAYRERMGI